MLPICKNRHCSIRDPFLPWFHQSNMNIRSSFVTNKTKEIMSQGERNSETPWSALIFWMTSSSCFIKTNHIFWCWTGVHSNPIIFCSSQGFPRQNSTTHVTDPVSFKYESRGICTISPCWSNWVRSSSNLRNSYNLWSGARFRVVGRFKRNARAIPSEGKVSLDGYTVASSAPEGGDETWEGLIKSE